MRTGKGRSFCLDEDALKQADESRKTGKGLVGGDISRQPERKRGLATHLQAGELREGLTRLPELRRFPESDEEREDAETFIAHRPLEVEIGFGGGQFILGRAEAHPDTHFIGFEIRRNLCIPTVKSIVERELDNIRIVYEDMRQSLPHFCADDSLQRCSVFFPDPWWKKRHVKRRILVPSFLDMMAQKLHLGGILHIKTDVMPYAEEVAKLFEGDTRYRRDTTGELDAHFEGDLPTEREAFCTRKELPFADFRFVLEAREKEEG